MSGWIGVDLDGTLAHYEGWGDGSIGKPIPLMVERVKQWVAAGREVRIVTARVGLKSTGPHTDAPCEPCLEASRELARIEHWCREHLGFTLPITCCKDFGMIELWDDRCVQVIPNTGLPVTAVVDKRRVE